MACPKSPRVTNRLAIEVVGVPPRNCLRTAHPAGAAPSQRAAPRNHAASCAVTSPAGERIVAESLISPFSSLVEAQMPFTIKLKTDMIEAPNMNARMTAFLVGAALLFANVAMAAEISGKVVGVHDGDTITLLAPGDVELKVRLVGLTRLSRSSPSGTRQNRSFLDPFLESRCVLRKKEKTVTGERWGMCSPALCG